MAGLKFRRLNADEYKQILPFIHDGFCPDPRSSTVLIAEKGGQVIGRIFLLAPVHLEGPWVREPERTRTLGHGISLVLVKAAEKEAKSFGISKLFAYGTEETEPALQKLGFSRSPMSVWEKEI